MNCSVRSIKRKKKWLIGKFSKKKERGLIRNLLMVMKEVGIKQWKSWRRLNAREKSKNKSLRL